jgi:hypothetical protein
MTSVTAGVLRGCGRGENVSKELVTDAVIELAVQDQRAADGVFACLMWDVETSLRLADDLSDRGASADWVVADEPARRSDLNLLAVLDRMVQGGGAMRGGGVPIRPAAV